MPLFTGFPFRSVPNERLIAPRLPQYSALAQGCSRQPNRWSMLGFVDYRDIAQFLAKHWQSLCLAGALQSLQHRVDSLQDRLLLMRG